MYYRQIRIKSIALNCHTLEKIGIYISDQQLAYLLSAKSTLLHPNEHVSVW